MTLRILILFVFTSSVLFAQQPEESSESALLDYLLMNPRGVDQLQIDCLTEDCQRFLENAHLFPELKEVHFSNFKLPTHAQTWKKFKNLQAIQISKSPDLDLKELVKQLAAQSGITSLSLHGSFAQEIPRNVNLLTRLTHFAVTNNPLLDVEKTLQSLSQLPELKELSLSQNHIDELGRGIGLLRNLEVLDISVNNITKLPVEMRQLNKMKTLNMAGNLLNDPVATLKQIKEINLTNLSLDQHIPREELKELTALFPNASIFLVSEDGDRILLEPDNVALTAGASAGAITSASKEKPTRSITYGKFNVASPTHEVYSDAYLHFDEIADQLDAPLNFDSLQFDERFADTTYSNVWKIQSDRQYKNLALSLYHQGVAKETWFDFSKKQRIGLLRKRSNGPGSYILDNNRELTAFSNVKWVYAGPLSKREFARQYIKGKFYLDCRIHYHDDAKNFTLELKHEAGFDNMLAYLREKNRKEPLETAQATYELRYVRYLSLLAQRKEKFQRRLAETANRFRKMHIKAKNEVWKEFKAKYLSAEESELTMEEWMVYYDQIIGDEKAAINNSSVGWELLKRGYELREFVVLDSTAKSNLVGAKPCILIDEVGRRVADERVMFIDLTNKKIAEYQGGLGLNSLGLALTGTAEYAIFAELRNGQFVMASSTSLSRAMEAAGQPKRIVVSEVDKKLYTIGQVSRFLSR